MKHIRSVFILAFFLFSCSSNPKIKNENVESGVRSNKIFEQFKPMLQGVWVATGYINDLVKTRSPIKSRFATIASIYIDMQGHSVDSLHAGISLNNHEGSDFVIYFKGGLKPTSIITNLPDYNKPTNFYELGYRIKGGDTSLILYHYNKENKILDSTCYTKIVNTLAQDDMGYGIQYITNRQLFTGKYYMIDTLGQKTTVTFTKEGKVTGLLDFKDYYVNTDFTVEPDNNLDEVIFDLYTKKSKSFSFKSDISMLELYETKENEDSTRLILGDLKYKLIKLK